MTSLTHSITVPTSAPAAARPPHALTARLRIHAHVLPAFFVVLLVCAWFVTWGTWRLLDADSFGGFYDAQARSLLHGRIDVPPEAIGVEAFIRDAKTYGYFGLGPALLRLPLVAFFPGMDGHWSRLFVLAGCGVNLVCASWLFLLAREAVGRSGPLTRSEKWMQVLLVLCAGLGSTNLIMASRAYTFHEAILWGAAFSLVSACFLIRYSLDRRTVADFTARPLSGSWLLFAAGAMAFLAFLSRPTAGLGALAALGLIGFLAFARGVHRRDPTFLRHAPIAGAWVVLALGAYLATNYARFHTFDGVPVRYYGLYQSHPERMRLTGGHQFHLGNFRTTFLSYFGPVGVRLGGEFPWVYLRSRTLLFPEAVVDVLESTTSIPVSMPALFVLALVGCRSAAGKDPGARRFRLPIVALFLGGSVVLFTVGITLRYLHDFYPFLILAGALGAARLSGQSDARAARRAVQIVTLLASLSIAIYLSFAYDYQREIVGIATPAQRAELARVRSVIHQLFHPMGHRE